jgi:hypothetical protein
MSAVICIGHSKYLCLITHLDTSRVVGTGGEGGGIVPANSKLKFYHGLCVAFSSISKLPLTPYRVYKSQYGSGRWITGSV